MAWRWISSGDVFVADTYNNAVKEILAVNGSIPANPTINTLGSGFDYNPGASRWISTGTYSSPIKATAR